nr:unnamed protein product [Callosobruchus chinensis]
MEKAISGVSLRARKLVDMCQGQDVDDTDLSEPSDPFATDDSDEYIPSTSYQSSSDERGASDTERGASPQINIISNIVLSKNGSLMIDEETIERISTAFQETLGHNNESAINRGMTQLHFGKDISKIKVSEESS